MHAIKCGLVGATALAIMSFGQARTCFAQASSAQASSAQETSEESAVEKDQEIRELRDQLDALQRRLDAQIEALDQLKSELEAAKAQAAAAQAQAATIPAQVKRAVAATKPQGEGLHYKGVTISFGGFLAAEYVRRSIDTANDIATAYNGDYFGNDPLAHNSQSLFSARQSSLSALVAGDPGPQTHIRAFGQIDFQGAAQTANSVEDYSYNPRLMQLYGAVDWDELHLHLLAGQAWSLVTLNASGITPETVVIPPTIDGQYMPGFDWARQPQVRLTQDIDRQFWLALSLENPQTTFYTGANPLPAGVDVTYETHGTGLGYNSENTLSLDHVPDAVLKLADDVTFGKWTVHAEGFGLYRRFYEQLNYASKNVSGEAAGGALMIPVVPRRLDLQLSAVDGRGIGRYGSAQLPDVTFDPNGNIKPIRELIALAGVTVHPQHNLDVYVFAGEERASRQQFNYTDTSGATPSIVPYGYGNLLYSNAGCAGQGEQAPCVGNLRRVEQGTVGLWYEPYRGDFGAVRWGLQFSHTEFDAFTGVGGAPVATLNMVFTSFRYYPFGE
ncbi:MAG TPA: hypothetical protein VMU67_02705 [Steroidobacteraceae bacterium]|nr:hypothetical protein [Steroidobacteraceae bacterium]